MDLNTGFIKMANMISEDKRPDVQPILDAIVERFANLEILHWKDYQLSFFGVPELVDYAYNEWQPWKNDIIVASFAKTGTTWLRDICRYLIYEKDSVEFEMTKSFQGPHVYLESENVTKYELWEKLPWKRRILATHMNAGMMNLEKLRSSGVKIIYTIRNPKDRFVSMYNMIWNLPYPRESEAFRRIMGDSFSDFVTADLEGRGIQFNLKKGENYLDHILSWYPHRNDDNVMFVCYEDMKKDPQKEILKLAKFLEVDLTEAEAQNVADLTSFEITKERMKDVPGVPSFYNKGAVGNWKTHFTVALSERVDRMVEEKLSSTDIKFTYEL
uniref:amine sulfotransferase-like n=1 Tax=Ciona intestinalis TaxID=7719 RepID=UPI00089DAB6C|nr:amine sulfotransferase-like [Ciona intestinalis]|eukprot:XP_002120509.2 amine sulfotransferase-like [Ciona intestinalis]